MTFHVLAMLFVMVTIWLLPEAIRMNPWIVGPLAAVVPGAFIHVVVIVWTHPERLSQRFYRGSATDQEVL